MAGHFNGQKHMGSEPLPTTQATSSKFKPKSVYIIVYDDPKKGISIRVVRHDSPGSWDDLGLTGDSRRGYKEENVLVAQEIDPSKKAAYVSRFYLNNQARYYKEVERIEKPSSPHKPFDPTNLPEPIDFGINFDPENP